MSSRSIEHSSALPHESYLDRSMSRRQIMNGALALAGNAAAITVASRWRDIEEFFQEVYPSDEFLKGAEPLTDNEIRELVSEHEEEPIPFDEEIIGGRHVFEGSFTGNGSPVYLTFPAIERSDARLTVLDVFANNRCIRAGLISSPHPQPKAIQLGPFSEDQPVDVTVVKRFRGEEEDITPEELRPELSYPTNYTFRRLLDESMSFTMPRNGESVWDDCITEKIVVPYQQDGNYRLMLRKRTTAENSRYESLYDDHGRTYDDDWEMKLEVTPEGDIEQAFVSRRWHKTMKYDSNRLIFGTHPIVETYTDNNMVRPIQYFRQGMPYFADRPIIHSVALRELLREHRIVDPYLQEASFDELEREGKDIEDLEEDFNERMSRRKVIFSRR